jgi:AraC-like DNA-binding protein
MTTRRTAVGALARTAIEAAEAWGVDVESVLARAGIRIDRRVESDERIEVGRLMSLWELMAEASGDPWFGLHVGERYVSAKTVHVVGYAARHSHTLGECYMRTVRFARVTNEGSEIDLRVEEQRAFVRVGPAPGMPMWPRCYAETALAGYLTVGRKWTGVDFSPIGADFQHAAPADTAEYTRVFGAAVRFDAAKNELILPASVLELPLLEPDPALGAYLEARANVLLETLPERGFERDVRSKIDEGLASGAPLLATIASQLGMSARTLQRRLSAESLSFAALVEDVRRTTALGLIARPGCSVSEIAALTGYQDMPSFRAAFVRWTGNTPRAYRQRLASRAHPDSDDFDHDG